MSKSLLTPITSIIAIAALAFLSFYVMVKANPSQFMTASSSTVSTSTLQYLFPAVGTSTPLVFDGQLDGSFPVDTAALLVCMTASTTNSALSLNVEYSQDGITYAQNQLGALATTSPNSNLNTVQAAQWQYASTSLAGGLPAAQTSLCKIVEVKMPTRYARFFAYLPLLAAGNMASSSGIWSQWIGKKENR